MTRVVVIQPYVPRYRTAFFTALRESLASHHIDLQVVSGRGPGGRSDEAQIRGQRIVRDLLGPVTGDRLRLRVAKLESPDLIVVEQAVKNLESYPLILRQRWSGPPVAMWGHGSTLGRQRRRFIDSGKAALTRQVDWFFAYTESGADSVRSIGFPSDRITVVQNSIDTGALRENLESVSPSDVEEYLRELGAKAGRVGLFLGRLEADKGIEYLAEVADVLNEIDPDMTLLVGGAGPLVSALSGKPNVRLLGRVDGRAKALALRAADLLLIPQWVGLVAVDALVSGVPIVTIAGNRHMPEMDYLTDGRTAVVLRPAASASEFAVRVNGLLDEPERVAEMGLNCRTDAREVSLDAMVANFRDGLLAWRSRTIDGRGPVPSG